MQRAQKAMFRARLGHMLNMTSRVQQKTVYAFYNPLATLKCRHFCNALMFVTA